MAVMKRSFDVPTLPVQRRRIVRCEEDVEQVAVAQHVVVELDANRLGMASVAAANLLVGGIVDLAADVTAFDRVDALKVEVDRLGAPEAPAGNDCDFLGHVRFTPFDVSNDR